MKFLLMFAMVSLASGKKKAVNADKLKNIDNKLLEESIEEAKGLVDKAYNKTRNRMKENLKKNVVSPADFMASFKRPVGNTSIHIRMADYMATTHLILATKCPGLVNISDMLTDEQKEILNKKTGCASLFLPKVCSQSPYRTINGECNNRKKRFLGASNTGFMRLLTPDYEDNRSLPKGWTENRTVNGFRLPLAREVSNVVVNYANKAPENDTSRSAMFMVWGQFTDHDMTFSPDTPSRTAIFEGVDCDTSCIKAYPCFPLRIPENDPRIKNLSDCIPLFRSAPVCNQKTHYREQINALTAFIDGSQIYGNDQDVAMKLRNNTNNMGLLAINQNYTDKGRPLLPFSGSNADVCTMTNTSAGIPCFAAGDPRATEQLGLTSMHTLFMREHNRIATELHKLNPHWSGEQIYNEARMIIGSMLQKFTFKEWLPAALGDEMSKVLPEYTGYDENVDPSVSNVFTIAFRFGHTTVPPLVYRLTDGYQPHPIDNVLLLHQTFFQTWRIPLQGGIDPFLLGLIASYAKLNTQDKIMDNELRDHLFDTVKRIGLDLAAINIQRGRERGMPGYNAWRKYCGLSTPKNEKELAIVLNNKNLAKQLIDQYGTPDNIDIWVGAVCEPLVSGGRIGELLRCLIANQFRRSRDGDRYYYANISVLTPAQKKSIENASLSKIICDNTDIKEVPPKIFMGNEYPKDYVKCSSIPGLDLTPWQEPCK